MKAGLDQMTAWLLALVLTGALFGAGYGITRMTGHGGSQGPDGHEGASHESQGEAHGEGHDASHGSDHEGGHEGGHGSAHDSSGSHSDPHGTSHDAPGGHADSHGSSSGGHEAAREESHGAVKGHGEGHSKQEKGTASHGSQSEHGDSGQSGHAPKDQHPSSSEEGAHTDKHGGGHNGAHQEPASSEKQAHGEDAALQIKWGYDGAISPAYWADLSPEFTLCRTGKAQSPIDIEDTGANAKLLPIRFSYQAAALKLRHSGRALEAEVPGGSYVEVDGERYDLRMMRFHTPSEHKVAGAPYDMELQLLHSSAEGQKLHIAVFFEEGSPHKKLSELWAHLPEEIGQEGDPISLNSETLLPGRRVYFSYKGSLTTPPCTEGVKWFVLAQANDISSKQVDQLARLVMRNVRPTSPLNGRKVVRSTR